MSDHIVEFVIPTFTDFVAQGSLRSVVLRATLAKYPVFPFRIVV